VKRVVDSENLALFWMEDGDWWSFVEPNASPGANSLSGQALSMLHLFGLGIGLATVKAGAFVPQESTDFALSNRVRLVTA
jgi:hypothetical protein